MIAPHSTMPRPDVPSAGQRRRASVTRDPVRLAPGPLLLAMIGFETALLLQVLTLAVNVPGLTSYGITLLCLCSALMLVRALYADGKRFLFSTGFWLVVTVFFYMVLKSIDIWSNDWLSETLIEVLWWTIGFLVAYCVAFALSGRSRHGDGAGPTHAGPIIPPGSEWRLLLVFAGFKLLGVLLMAGMGFGGEHLEVLAATQNAGAAYVFKIPQAGNVILLGLLFHSFRNRRGWTVTLLAMTLYLGEAILTTSRLAIVMLVLWTAFLYHRYRRPIPLLGLALVSAPLVVVVVLFGYARNIGVGSVEAFREALQLLLAEPTLITDLFMARLDLLPEMVLGLELYRNGTLESLNGGSYIYAFLHAVPRNLWEAKPPLTAALLTAETHPLAFSEGVNIFPSLIIEGILNFSYPGVILTGLLTGYLARQYERIMGSEHLAAVAWTLSAFTFPMALFNEGVHSNFTGTLLYMTALMALIYKGLLVSGVLVRPPRTA